MVKLQLVEDSRPCRVVDRYIDAYTQVMRHISTK